jgi:hypothetical protein
MQSARRQVHAKAVSPAGCIAQSVDWQLLFQNRASRCGVVLLDTNRHLHPTQPYHPQSLRTDQYPIHTRTQLEHLELAPTSPPSPSNKPDILPRQASLERASALRKLLSVEGGGARVAASDELDTRDEAGPRR